MAWAQVGVVRERAVAAATVACGTPIRFALTNPRGRHRRPQQSKRPNSWVKAPSAEQQTSYDLYSLRTISNLAAILGRTAQDRAAHARSCRWTPLMPGIQAQSGFRDCSSAC